MDQPTFLPHASLELARRGRGFALQIDGLWSVGSLAGLAQPCVAIVGTRSATPYGRGLAGAFARDLVQAGCCIVSGLALGIDAAAHEGALDAHGATIGVLGSGHERFFPSRNRDLAARMVAAGGAVLSPYPPDRRAYPSQFLERNGVVAALADALVVIEAPARSGALNTANWAAPRIPVLAVPGDVDRTHVAGCHALIRDGATLARNAGDVLEALGMATAQLPLALPASAQRDPLAQRLLETLKDGERDLDDLVAHVQATTAAVLAALALLEIEGGVERCGATRFAHARRSTSMLSS